MMAAVETDTSDDRENTYYVWPEGNTNYHDLDFGIRTDNDCCCET